jgi:hypothetical protein
MPQQRKTDCDQDALLHAGTHDGRGREKRKPEFAFLAAGAWSWWRPQPAAVFRTLNIPQMLGYTELRERRS